MTGGPFSDATARKHLGRFLRASRRGPGRATLREAHDQSGPNSGSHDGQLRMSSTLAAQQEAVRPEMLPRSEEMEIALSAAPAHLRAHATVWVLEDSGYVVAREGSNGFACIINRDHPMNRKPTCYDAEGAATILPKVLYVGKLMMRGIALAAINDSVLAGFQSARFIAPRRPGVAYMLTDRIRTYNPQTRSFGTFPPHLMFYAPNLTNAELGVSREARNDHPWLPFVAYQGPHGFIIVLVNR